MDLLLTAGLLATVRGFCCYKVVWPLGAWLPGSRDFSMTSNHNKHGEGERGRTIEGYFYYN